MRHAFTASASAVLIATVLALTGCSSDDTDQGPGSASPGGSPAAAAAPNTPAAPDDRIDVVVANGRVSPKPSVHHVHLGDRVRLSVTSDQADEVHLHGYDKEIEIQPGRAGTVDFTADVPGIFEVETHKSNLQLLQLEVK